MKASTHAMRLDVLGDSAWFSTPGRSICYLVTVGDGKYLVDLGASPFRALGVDGLNNIRGIFATHSHDDHRRWFTDLALFHFYAPFMNSPMHLYTSEAVQEEYAKNSKAAIERSLSFHSDRLVDVPYNNMVQPHLIGPRARYYIDKHPRHAVQQYAWRVYDRETGELVPPQRAKVVINPEANRPRMLFRDPETDLWVEPEAFYDFSSTVFYEAEQNDFVDEVNGLRVRAVKAAAWHGPPVIGLVLETETERLAFSSDTVFDPALWQRLAGEVREQDLAGMTPEQFEKAPVLYGDINNYIQRTWSRGRLDAAMHAYDGAVVVHDSDYAGAVVHTAYEVLAQAYSLGEVDWRRLVCCHAPDNYVSAYPILYRGKTYEIRDGEILERVDGDALLPLDADIYVKIDDAPYVGVHDNEGTHEVYRDRGGLLIREVGAHASNNGEPAAQLRVRLYHDREGHYLPLLDDENQDYVKRPDGRWELVTYEPTGSHGRLVEDQRRRLRMTPRRGSKTGILGRAG